MDTVTDAPTKEALAAILKPKKRKAPSKVAKAARPDKVKKSKPKAKKAKKKVKKPKSAACVRSERLDMRLTKAEKTKVHARAKKLRRTVTSIVIEAIEKIK